MNTMLAAYLEAHGNNNVIRVGKLSIPKIGPTEALVRLKYSALNHLDLWVRNGLPGLSIQFPHVLGGDGSGIVAEVGSHVDHVKPGDSVIVHPGLSCLHCRECLSGWESLCNQYKILGEHTWGTNAQYVKVPAANIFHKPMDLDFTDAAAIGLVFTTAWQMLVNRAHIRPGETILIHAAGSGVSSAAIQIARLWGAEVIATSTSNKKLELAKQLGAQHAINTKESDFLEEIKLITHRRGVDIVFDHVGQIFWEFNIKAVRSGGRIVICGATSGSKATTDLRHIYYRQIQILGSTMGSKADFSEIINYVASHRLKAVIDRVFTLDRAKDAFERLETGEQFGKILLKIEQT